MHNPLGMCRGVGTHRRTPRCAQVVIGTPRLCWLHPTPQNKINPQKTHPCPAAHGLGRVLGEGGVSLKKPDPDPAACGTSRARRAGGVPGARRGDAMYRARESREQPESAAGEVGVRGKPLHGAAASPGSCPGWGGVPGGGSLRGKRGSCLLPGKGSQGGIRLPGAGKAP